MKLDELIKAGAAGMVGAVSVDEAFDAEHGAMNQTTTYGPGLVDLDTFRTLRNVRPHVPAGPGFTGSLTQAFPTEGNLGQQISQHRNTSAEDGLT